MSIMRRLAFVVIAAVTLSGCATKVSVLGQKTELALDGLGYVAASLVQGIDAYDTSLKLAELPLITAMFYEAGKSDQHAFYIDTSIDMNNRGLWYAPNESIEEPRGRRALSLVKVQPGRYQLGRVTSTFPLYKKSWDITPMNPGIIEVRSGEITYIGSIHFVNTVGKNIFGQVLPDQAALRLSDEFDTDVPAIKRADPRLTDVKVRNGFQR